MQYGESSDAAAASSAFPDFQAAEYERAAYGGEYEEEYPDEYLESYEEEYDDDDDFFYDYMATDLGEGEHGSASLEDTPLEDGTALEMDYPEDDYRRRNPPVMEYFDFVHCPSTTGIANDGQPQQEPHSDK